MTRICQLEMKKNKVGDIVNIAPTIAEILGFKNDIVNTGLLASNQSFFDLI